MTLPFETLSSATGTGSPALGLLPSLVLDKDRSNGSATQNTVIATPTGGNVPVINPVITASMPRNGTAEATRSGNAGTNGSGVTATKSGTAPSGTNSAGNSEESGGSGSGSGDKPNSGGEDDGSDNDNGGNKDNKGDGSDNGESGSDETGSGNSNDGSNSGNSGNSADGISTTFASITLVAGETLAQTSASATGTPSSVTSLGHRSAPNVVLCLGVLVASAFLFG